MTYAEFTTLVRIKTQSDTNTFPDSDLIIYANMARDEIVSAIADRVDDDVFLSPTVADLVADQREYPLPTDFLQKLKRVEVSFDGSDNWIILKELDLENTEKTTVESIIISNYSNNQDDCGFDRIRGGIYIYSGTIINVTGGLKLYYDAQLRKLVTGDLILTTDMSLDRSTTEHGFPARFHELFAVRTAMKWKADREKPIQLNETEKTYPRDLEIAIEQYAAALPYYAKTEDDGSDNGFNY